MKARGRGHLSAEDITSMIKNEVRKEKVALERKIKGLSEANRELKDSLSRIEDEIDELQVANEQE
jgi:hypothetical protein